MVRAFFFALAGVPSKLKDISYSECPGVVSDQPEPRSPLYFPE
jgi:hypothetical protein